MAHDPDDLLTNPDRGTLALPDARERRVMIGGVAALAATLGFARLVADDPGLDVLSVFLLLALAATACLWIPAWRVRRQVGPDPTTSTLVLLLLVYLGGFGPPLVVLGALALERAAAGDAFFAGTGLAAAAVATAGPALELLWRHWHVRSLRARRAAAAAAPGDARMAELEHLAFHDALTGLPNRRHFERALDEALDAASRAAGDDDCAVIFIDFDRFKPINDIHGHAAGDAFLVAVSRRLAAQLRASDLLARLGGDEFAVLLRGAPAAAAAVEVAQRIGAAMAEPVGLGDAVSVRTSSSVGIAAAGRGEPAQALLARADAAMYRAKAAGGAQHAFDGPPPQRQALAAV